MSTPIPAAILAGQAILSIYEKDFEVYEKSDLSPLTEADLQAHKVIVAHLSQTDYPVLSEEGRDIPYETRKHWKRFWMVDPLDGTKEFVKRNGEFTVNIALIEDGRPIFGVIYVPVEKTLYVGEVGKGAVKYSNIHTVNDWENAEGVALPMPHHRDHLVVVGSRSHMSPETEAFIATLPPPNFPTPKPPNLLTSSQKAPPSNSAWSPKAPPMFTRDFRPPWNGTPLPVRPFVGQQVAMCCSILR